MTAEPHPHLIHIGFAKSGSTWLQQWFASHPGFAWRDFGIGGYGDVYDLVRQSANGGDLRCRVTSFEAFATPLNWVDDFDCAHGSRLVPKPGGRRRVCELLAGLFPNARVLLITRGYRSLLLSTYSELVRGGASSSLEAFADGQAALARRGLSPFDFDAVIALYRAAFGAENLIVLPFELLAVDPAAFTRAIEAAASVAPHPPLPGPARPGLSPSQLYWVPWITRGIARLPIGARLRRKLFNTHVTASRRDRPRRLVRVLERTFDRRVTDDAIPEEAVEAFRGSAEELRALPVYAPFAREYLLDG